MAGTARTVWDETMNKHEERLRLCEYAGWCQSTDTQWSSDTGKWLCRACEARVRREAESVDREGWYG